MRKHKVCVCARGTGGLGGFWCSRGEYGIDEKPDTRHGQAGGRISSHPTRERETRKHTCLIAGCTRSKSCCSTQSHSILAAERLDPRSPPGSSIRSRNSTSCKCAWIHWGQRAAVCECGRFVSCHPPSPSPSSPVSRQGLCLLEGLAPAPPQIPSHKHLPTNAPYPVCLSSPLLLACAVAEYQEALDST